MRPAAAFFFGALFGVLVTAVLAFVQVNAFVAGLHRDALADRAARAGASLSRLQTAANHGHD